MPITPVSNSLATALGAYGDVTGRASARRSPNPTVRSLANSQILQSQAISQGLSTGTQAALGQSYSQLTSQTSVGQKTVARASVQSLLNTYLQNSSVAANAASQGTPFKTSA